MTKKKNTDTLLAHIIEGIEEVKGEDINVLDLREIENNVCQYFVVCSGNSNTQVRAISGAVQKLVSKAIHEKPCLLYTSPSPRDATLSRMPSSA